MLVKWKWLEAVKWQKKDCLLSAVHQEETWNMYTRQTHHTGRGGSSSLKKEQWLLKSRRDETDKDRETEIRRKTERSKTQRHTNWRNKTPIRFHLWKISHCQFSHCDCHVPYPVSSEISIDFHMYQLQTQGIVWKENLQETPQPQLHEWHVWCELGDLSQPVYFEEHGKCDRESIWLDANWKSCV